MAKVGFIGLGGMGRPMAENLLKAGHELTVWNRTHEKAEPLRRMGARVAESPADVAPPDGLVITMLSADAALDEVCEGDNGLLARLGEGGLHVSMSTIAPETARRLAAGHGARGAGYLAAPVFGRPDAAAAGRLFVCLSGTPADKERARPVLEAFAAGFYDYGAEAGAANVIKLAGNFMLAAAMEAMAEAYTLVEKHGLDRMAFHRQMTETLFACPAYRNYGGAIAEHHYQPPGFPLRLGLKDMDLVLAAARRAEMPMPFAGMLHNRFLEAVANHLGEIDWAGIGLSVAHDAGLHHG